MRKNTILTILCIVSMLITGAVVAQDDDMMGWECPEGFEGQELNVYNWTTYIAEDTIANFEELCGVSVTYTTFPSDDEMLARIRQGNPGFDIVVPSGSTVSLMIGEGLLEAIDYDNVPNFANLSAELLDPPYDPGNVYSVPYQWGTVGIGYNVEAVSMEITSWNDMFQYDGPVSWLDDNRVTIGVALLLLGYDPNTGDADEIAEARDYLVENGSNVTYINQDDGQEVLVRGEADMVVEYSGDIFQIMDECECEDYAYVIPDEGTNVWVDNLAIPVDAPNKALAEVFIDYILDAQVGADISNYTAYASPNQAAIDGEYIDAELLGDTGIYPTEEAMANMFFVETDPEKEQLYNDAWDEMRIFLGQ